MNRVTPLIEIDNFKDIADSLRRLLPREDNSDIAQEFDASFKNYTGRRFRVVGNLKKARDLYQPGTREQFIAFAGERAVGLSLVSTQVEPPPGVDAEWPNISYFVCRPFRRQGLGRLSITACMKAVARNFDNRAWTVIKDGNSPSEHLVTSVGFNRIDRPVEGWKGYNLYLFDGNGCDPSPLPG
jgi:GNAT superfamily N-acetyltransferase